MHVQWDVVGADTGSNAVVEKVESGRHYPGSHWSDCATSVVCRNTATQLMNTDLLHTAMVKFSW